MIIQVTKKHIKNGIRSDAVYCPIALAIKDTYTSRDVFVGENSIAVHTKKLSTYYYLPSRAIRFVSKFDRGKKVQPFRFRLVEKTR